MVNLLKLLGRRLAVLPFMILGITLLVFLIMSQASPDIAAVGALGEGASIAAREEWIAAHGFNDPLPIRYIDYLGGLLQGDMGVYGGQNLPVTDRIASAFPVTFQLTMLGLVVAVIGALILGVVAALYRDKWPDQVIRVISILCLATPSFWLAVLLIQSFTLALDWLPGSGKLPELTEDPVGYLRRMALPAFALGVPVMGQLTRVVRTSMVEELDRGYVQTAVAAGIPYPNVVARNVLRNALITPVTVLGLRVGYLMGGAVVIEIIFNLPGMGRAILEGVTGNQPFLVQGVTLIVALAFVIVNIIVDLLYVFINPRIRSV